MPYDTKEELLKLGEMDPELAAVLQHIQMPPMDLSNVEDFVKLADERMGAAMNALGEPPASIKQSEVHYTTRDGTKMRAKLYQPSTPPKSGSPFVVMFHGGGFCLGSPEGEEQSCRTFVSAFGAVCVSASYRLAPKFPFPYSMNDSWDALQWAAANAKSFGADPSLGFVVGGTSAGGNISAVLAHLARDEKLSPPLTGQYLAIPPIVPESRMPEKYKSLFFSYEQNKDAPILPKPVIDMLMSAYKADDDSPLFNVLAAPKGHANLPPAYIQICGLDPLRDEAFIYERILSQENGVKTKLDVYPGLPHGFWGMFPMLSSANKFREDMVKGMGWLLHKEPNLQAADTDAVPAVV